MDKDFDFTHWENVKDKLKRRYPQLTDSDIIWRHETKDDLFAMIATKLVMSKKELATIVDSL
jgi:hypothetical protein